MKIIENAQNKQQTDMREKKENHAKIREILLCDNRKGDLCTVSDWTHSICIRQNIYSGCMTAHTSICKL